MKAANFAYLSALLRERSGLVVTQDKEYLLHSRLARVARLHGVEGLDELVIAMRASLSETLVGEVVDAMTTNETSFFRDKNPFDSLLTTIIPGLVARRRTQRALRIWSAACSTGQEPYSLAMILSDRFPTLNDWRVEIVATDISPTAIDRASEGVFSAFEVQRGLPVKLLARHFEQIGQNWRVKPELRRMIGFRPLNLLGDIAALGRFDIILCRNVLIYFDPPTKASVLNRMARMLAPDGALMLGGSESIVGICDSLADVTGLRGVYGLATGKGGSKSFQHAPPARAAF